MLDEYNEELAALFIRGEFFICQIRLMNYRPAECEVVDRL